MRKLVVGSVSGLVVGVVLGITVLTPKLSSTSHQPPPVQKERDLTATGDKSPIVLPALQRGGVIRWRTAPAYPSDQPIVARQAKDYAKKLAAVSGDKMILPSLPAKEPIAAETLFGALASGRIDALFATAEIATSIEPALAIFGGLPFGPTPERMLNWTLQGTGGKYLNDLFGNHNIKPLVCGYLPAHSGGWFKNDIINPETFKEIQVRAEGLTARVWQKAGGKTVSLPADEIAANFDQNLIDGVIFSSPEIDAKTGFEKFAKTYYFPGWHHKGQPLFLLLNARAWKQLDNERQNLLSISCAQTAYQEAAKQTDRQIQSLQTIVGKDVHLARLPSFLVTRLENAWQDVLAEEARRDPAFRETWEALKLFIARQEHWQEINIINPLEADFN